MSKVKETALRILSLLPGVDCGGFGGCGYPTCEACALKGDRRGEICSIMSGL